MLTAFGLAGGQAEHLPGGRGMAFRCGESVLKPVDEPAEAAWLAGTFEQLRVTGLRLARPVRASDGRWVVAGWCAQRFVSGVPEPRYDEIITASLTLHEATARLPQPKFLALRSDLYSRAERLAWGEPDGSTGDLSELGDGHGARLFETLANGRRPVDLRHQLVHGDLFGNVLFAGAVPPAVVDITPYWRPPEWAAAVIAVDALSWGGAGTDLLETGSSWPSGRRCSGGPCCSGWRSACCTRGPLPRPWSRSFPRLS